MNYRYTSRQTSSGFTLIELLVVIAIIAILAAILFPVFATAREKARQATCASNLKQLGLAFIQYEQDYDEYFPVGTPSQIAGDEHKSGWATAIYPYVKTYAVYSCPDDLYTPPNLYNKCSYYMSWALTGYNNGTPTNPGPPMLLSQLMSPSQSVELAECTKNYWSLPTTAIPLGDNSPTACGFSANSTLTVGSYAMGPLGGSEYLSNPAIDLVSTYLPPRHSGGANYLAFDGHVKWLIGTQVSPGYTYWPHDPISTYSELPSWYEDYAGTLNAASTTTMTNQAGTAHFVMTFSGV